MAHFTTRQRISKLHLGVTIRGGNAWSLDAGESPRIPERSSTHSHTYISYAIIILSAWMWWLGGEAVVGDVLSAILYPPPQSRLRLAPISLPLFPDSWPRLSRAEYIICTPAFRNNFNGSQAERIVGFVRRWEWNLESTNLPEGKMKERERKRKGIGHPQNSECEREWIISRHSSAWDV